MEARNVSENTRLIIADDHPGELERLCHLLAKRGVNVSYVYGSTTDHAASPLIFGVDDVDQALQVLEPRRKKLRRR